MFGGRGDGTALTFFDERPVRREGRMGMGSATWLLLALPRYALFAAFIAGMAFADDWL